MPMHDDNLAAEALQLTHEPRAINECGTNALGEKLGRLGILYEMVMQGDDPAGTREAFGNREQSPGLLDRDETQRVGEGELGIRIAIKQNDPRPVVTNRWHSQ